jgi:glycine oxidase
VTGADVVIAGGGLIGLGVAWRCVQRGLTVTVVDEGFAGEPDGGPVRPRGGASFAAGGMLAPVSEASYGEERLLGLCLDSLRRYPGFVAELEAATGIDVGLRTDGTLQVGFDADDMAALDQLHAFHKELGLPAQRLTPGEARRLEPALTPRLRAAVHVPGDHSVDGRALHGALLAAVAGAGATLVPDRVTELIVHHGRTVGLRCGTTTVSGDQVVLALGSRSAHLPGAPALPVRPVGGQILRLRMPVEVTRTGGAHAGTGRTASSTSASGDPGRPGDDAGPLRGTIRGLVRGRAVYLVPLREDRGGADIPSVIVGATSEEKGYHSRVTAGGVFELLRDAIEVVPELAEAELAETVVRFRPGTPDNAPILGPTEVAGLVAATGHYRNGVLLTPVTADAIAALVAGDGLPEVARGFGPERFGAAVHSGASLVHSGGPR